MLNIIRTVPFFAPAYGHGGPVVHTLNISKIQAKLGYNIRVFTSNVYKENASSKMLKFENIGGVKVHRFPIKLQFGHYYITPKILTYFNKYECDLIHAHSYRTFQTDISTLISKVKNKPLVFTAHGTLRNMFLLKLFLTKQKKANRMKFYDLFLKKFFLNTVDRVIVHSNHEKYWTLKFQVPEEKIRVIPHGVNLEDFSNKSNKEQFFKKYAITNNEKIILYVGRLFRNYRNIHHIIQVLKDIEKTVSNVKLWIVGHSFDKDYELELRKLAKDLEISKKVLFFTNPTREDVLGAYQSCDFVVFPITEADGFGIPILEAGASKRPIVSTARGPALELIKNGKTGLLAKKSDPKHLKELIFRLLTNDELRIKLGRNGFKNISEHYTWQKIAEQTNQVYDELF